MSDAKVVFYCDGSRCSVCNMDMCMHTTDIEYAENFRRVPGTDVWEEILKDENTTTWIGAFAPYTCKHCGFHVDSKTKYCPECGRKAVQDYGNPEDNFAMIARLWTDYYNDEDVKFTAKDVAMMMALLKVARIRTGKGTRDSYVDLAGYAACAGEIAETVEE